MTRHLVAALLVTTLALGLGAVAGDGAGFTGAGIASLTALASLAGFRLLGRSAQKPLQRALLIFVVMFLVRLVLVVLGLVRVTRAGESVTAFVVAFFVPYFAFAAIEGSYVHALGRSPGRTA
ncbi:MAG TPA: hypothetical protein VFR85_06360 [Anaeromyxobacteraceae bacterium]|nr:hypothetical protein [Anaeromyxobacteraceae bacterium]